MYIAHPSIVCLISKLLRQLVPLQFLSNIKPLHPSEFTMSLYSNKKHLCSLQVTRSWRTAKAQKACIAVFWGTKYRLCQAYLCLPDCNHTEVYTIHIYQEVNFSATFAKVRNIRLSSILVKQNREKPSFGALMLWCCEWSKQRRKAVDVLLT